MASLSLKHINKTYPNGFEAVKDFNLEIEDKEFIIFVGPSGCGKSTLLKSLNRMIHPSLENHLFILFLQTDFVVVHGLIVVTQVHTRSSGKSGIDK